MDREILQQLHSRLLQLEEQMCTQEVMKEQIRQLEQRLCACLIQEMNRAPDLLEKESQIQETRRQNGQENGMRISDSEKQLPERDTGKSLQETLSKSKYEQFFDCSYSECFVSLQNGSSKEIPSEVDKLKGELEEERKKNRSLEEILQKCKLECSAVKKRLKSRKDMQCEMTQCHFTLLNKAMSASSVHKQNLKLLLEFVRRESETLREKLKIHHTIQSADYSMTQILIDAGDDVNVPDDAGFTPLHDVAGGGYIEMAKILLEGGANLEAKATGGMRPLHQAAMYGHLSMCQLLLDKGCSVNARSDFNSTPLHHAAENGHLEVVKLLVERGADPNAVDGDGVTPWEDATRAGHIAVAMWLAQNFSVEEQEYCLCGKPHKGLSKTK